MFFKILFKWNLISCLVIAIAILFFHIKDFSVIPLLEMEKCPVCYGVDLCSQFENGEVQLYYENLSQKFDYFLNVKNTFIGQYKNEKVILKKLGQSAELRLIDKYSDELFDNKNAFLSESGECQVNIADNMTKEISELLLVENENFVEGEVLNRKILCPTTNVTKFVTYLPDSFTESFIWTILQINSEPIVLKILDRNDGWPVPRYYGACGRMVVEEYCGNMLNSFKDSDWLMRASLAKQLLEASVMFTNAHPAYRIYLTDVSSDNIAVDDQFRIRFIDMENVLVLEKNITSNDVPATWNMIHVSETIDDCENCFVFSQKNICAHSESDHNYYAICKLLLSVDSPWPMMSGGLLHSVPAYIDGDYPTLSRLLENCVQPKPQQTRYLVVLELINLLDKIITSE